eukprot:Gregarina_sp_Pseudo_9__3325@NODE_34_length_5483_cov_39_119581_g31_i0_p2_GENE_NODE_34_length_5483_cov_39_119581_g31_i0NODE_34_length_5483_cov_39_119581_g31_i0_p2_ORF_typecomplete_len437_score110_86_NODE_34_length_5483_cov_39_119581_g31_i030094319
MLTSLWRPWQEKGSVKSNFVVALGALAVCSACTALLRWRLFAPHDFASWVPHSSRSSSLYRFVTRSPHTLDVSELRRLVDVSAFERRRLAFYSDSYGLRAHDIARARKFGFCPEDPAAPQPSVLADKELGYNLEGLLPHAYYLHLYGCLNGTRSYDGAAPFFFFDPQHRQFDKTDNIHIYNFNTVSASNPFMQVWNALSAQERADLWNPLRAKVYPAHGLEWPPYKEFYGSALFAPLRSVGKRVAIVSGKHNKQWGGKEPVNTFALPELLGPILETLLQHDYIVIYNRMRQKLAGDADYSLGLDPGDYDLIHSHFRNKDVITFEDFWRDTALRFNLEEKDLIAFNLLQLGVYAQADLFIDTQGGGSVIASLFGGDHLILHRQGHEQMANRTELASSWAYYNWWRHGGGRYWVVESVDELLAQLQGLLYKREKNQNF